MHRQVIVRVLGPTDLMIGDKPVVLGSARQRRLLVALVLGAGEVVSADRLIDCVWADGELPDNPRRALRTNLARLRHVLGSDEVIVTEARGWRFDTSAAQVDSRQFAQLLDEAADPGIDVHRRLARLDEALRLWRGDAFEEVAAEDWARSEALRLEELRIVAIERRFETMLAKQIEVAGSANHTWLAPPQRGQSRRAKPTI